MNIEMKLTIFKELIKKHSKLMEKNNVSKANEIFKEYSNIAKELHDNGNLIELKKFLNDEDEKVKFTVASKLLMGLNDPDAKSILLDISKNKGFTSFNAKMVLKEWEKGSLKN